jgi:hypothetical protein
MNTSNPSLLKMFMLPEDYKQAEAIERRRRFEEDRKCRIFNARQRLIGVSNPSSLVGCGDLYKVRYRSHFAPVRFLHEAFSFRECVPMGTVQMSYKRDQS